MLGIAADIVADMPAALALGVLLRGGFDLFVVVTHDTGSRDDEDEFQVVTQRRQGVELVASTADFDSGLQCRADLAGFALGFQGLGHIGARGATRDSVLPQFEVPGATENEP